MMKAVLELIGMEFHAFHGCLPQERVEGATYLVDFRASCDISAAAESDELADTVDYGRIHDIVAAEMAVPSNLIEHVGARIVRAIKAEFPDLGEFEVSVAKLNPPVAGKAAWSRITVKNE